MEESKVSDLIKAEKPVEKKTICLTLPTVVKDVLIDDINYCKERILESQKKLENIQTLLKLTRYSTIKDFYENKKTILDTTDDQLLQCTLSHQHPSVLAAQEQLLKLQSRPKRQAAKKVLISTKKEKLEKIRLKSKHADIHMDTKLLDIKLLPNNKEEIEKKIAKVESANNNSTEKNAVSDPVLPVLNANRSSRFYSRYKLLIGNTSQFLGDDNFDKCTHNWCIYVRRPEDQPNASEIIRKVRFHLDASYKPNDVIEVVSEPFSLSKRGWGEFPIKVEMFFKSNDKPVSFIHNLKLDKLKTGRYCLDTETAVEVVLDINPNLKETSTKETRDTDLSRKKLQNGEDLKDELALTNIRNILKYTNLSSNNESSVKPIVDRDVKIKPECLSASTTCQFDDYIYLKEPLLIHCISNNCDNEYLIKVPQKHSSLNLKYLETPEKLMFLNSLKNDASTVSKHDIKTLHTEKLDNIANFESNQNLKRKCCSELSSVTANKVKIVDSVNVNGVVSPKSKSTILKPLKLNENLTKPTGNKLEINAAQQTLLKHNIKPNSPSVKKNPALNFSKQSSLLKCNNLTNKLNIKTHMDVKQSQNVQSSKKSLLFNNSLLSSSFAQSSSTVTKPDGDNPKIIIVRRGNSVLTTQNTFITQPKRIQLSPERKLLGPKKNTDDKRISDFGYNANSCPNHIVYTTFDNDVDNLKRILGQLDIRQVVEYALKRVTLYAKPENTHGIFFEVPTQQEFANYSLIKQIALEIKRSKCIYDFLKSLYPTMPEHWDYVRIFRYAREYGYLPKEHKYWSKINNDELEKSLIGNQDNPGSTTKKGEKKTTYRSYTKTDDLLSYFDKLLVSIPKDVHDTVEDVDIESVSDTIKHTERTTARKNLMLPVLYGDKESCQYIINSAKTLGITFQPEQLAIGVDHPSALEVMCSVLKCFLSEVVRKSLGVCRLQGGSSIEPEHVFSSILSRQEFDMLSNKNLGS